MALAIPEGGLPLAGTRYVLRRRLGEGSFGDAYLADDPTLGRRVVIKVSKDHGTTDVAARFLREAKILARIRHRGVVEIHDLGVLPEGFPYYVMEWVDAQPLSDHLRARGTISAAEACQLLAQACEALGAAHAEGVVHRDVKPDNLLVTARGELKVIDFGIAKRVANESANPTAKATELGALLGTPRYIAPEQATGQPITPATDLYALGCVLYEVLTGRPPFDGPLMELIRQHVQTPAPPLNALVMLRFPPRLEALVARLLSKDPASRGGSAEVVAGELRAIAGDASTAHLTLDVASRPRLPPTLPVTAPVAPPPVPTEPIGMARTEPSFRPPPIVPMNAPLVAPSRARADREGASRLSIAVIAFGAVVIVAIVIFVVLLARRDTGGEKGEPAGTPTAATKEAHEIDGDDVRARIDREKAWRLVSDRNYTFEEHDGRIFELEKGKKHATVSVYSFIDPKVCAEGARHAQAAMPTATFVVRSKTYGIAVTEPPDEEAAAALAKEVFVVR